MFIKELAAILIQGGLLLILALIGYFLFNDNCKKRRNDKKCNHIKKTSKVYNFIIEDSENIKKVL